MHLDDERLQRLLDGELSPADAPLVRAHLAECAGCRERAAVAERELAELDGLLGLLDHPVAVPPVDEVIEVPVRRWSGGARWAAAAVLAVALAGVAYAIPSSPLPRWIAIAAERLDPRHGAPRVERAPRQVPEAGVAVPPGQRLLIAFDSAQIQGEAVVTVQPGAGEVTIRAPRGAAAFAAGSDRVSVANTGSEASYTIQIPAEAPRVEIRVAGSRVFLKDGPDVSAAAGADSAAGTYRIPLRP
jgi:hypothetical protein